MIREDKVNESKHKPTPPYTVDPQLTFYCPQENVDAFDEPRIRRFWEHMLTAYTPPAPIGERPAVLLIVPCTKTKPYTLSEEHLYINRYLLNEVGFAPIGDASYPPEIAEALPDGFPETVLNNTLLANDNLLIHRMVVSEPMGLVPYDYLYHWQGELSIISRYDDPGLFEHRGTTGCVWRDDSTVTVQDSGFINWGSNEYMAYAEAHNRLSRQIATALERLRPHYAAILGYVAPEITHRSFLNDEAARDDENMRQFVQTDEGPQKLMGVNDFVPGLVRIVPDDVEQMRVKAALQQRAQGISAVEADHMFTLAGGEATAIIQPETLAILGKHLLLAGQGG
jgi:hypothetical protein